MRWIIAVVSMALAFAAYASDIGEFKNVRGSVHVERDGQRLVATPGMALRQHDTVVTGTDGAAGMTFLDNSRLSTGPNSVLQIERYHFDSTTHAGEFDASLRKGTLGVVSGQMVKQTPESMRVRTPSSIMGVRGTQFLVHLDGY
jgi:hypothetical protein